MRDAAKNKLFLIFVFFSFFLLLTQAAENKLTLSVTPSFFQLNLGPGDSWSSAVKVVNPNPYDLTLHVSTMNFQSEGEGGQKKFKPIIEIIEKQGTVADTLAQWIKVSKGTITVPKEKSAVVPFSLRIPQNASPGGHYAAILVSPRPLDVSEQDSLIQTSGSVSSFFFVQIKGDIHEEGGIKEFSPEKTFYQKPDVNFVLRFENSGNVHLRPQGEIVVYNTWGQERGKILLKQENDSTIVLPQSIRQFNFQWQGEKYLSSGRYKAVISLTYGEEKPQKISRSSYFWVLPLKPIAAGIGGFALFAFFMGWAIRVYAKSILEAETALRPADFGSLMANSFGSEITKASLTLSILMFLIVMPALTGAAIRYFVERSASASQFAASCNADAPLVPAAISTSASLFDILQKNLLNPAAPAGTLKEIKISNGLGNSLSFSESLNQLLPFFDKSMLDRIFKTDFTTLFYYNESGVWPVYVAEINDNQVVKNVIIPVLENYVSNFYLGPVGKFSDFKNGRLRGAPTRYAVSDRPGAAFNYGIFGETLVISTNFDGFKKAVDKAVDNFSF